MRRGSKRSGTGRTCPNGAERPTATLALHDPGTLIPPFHRHKRLPSAARRCRRGGVEVVGSLVRVIPYIPATLPTRSAGARQQRAAAAVQTSGGSADRRGGMSEVAKTWREAACEDGWEGKRRTRNVREDGGSWQTREGDREASQVSKHCSISRQQRAAAARVRLAIGN
jgi:hypothetical protein